jgi:ankyrin repeat protein
MNLTQFSIACRPVSQSQGIFENRIGAFADTITEFGNVPRPPTPTDIAVFTPINSPLPSSEIIAFDTVPMVLFDAPRHTPEMPWTQLQDLMSKMIIPQWELGSQSCPLDAQARVGDYRIRDILRPSIGLSSGRTQLQHTIQSLKPTISDHNSPLALRKPQCYLPRAKIASLDTQTYGVVGLSHGMTEPDLLKLLIGTASNNLETDKTTKFVMELVEDKSYETLLKSLLEQKIDTVSAFAEKLLVPAAQGGKWDLVKAIIESGVYVDTLSDDYLGRFETAIQPAVDQGNVDMVRYLIEQGAKDFSTNFRSQFNKRWIAGGTIVDLAVDRGHHKLIKSLLQNATSGRVQFPKVTIYHLRNAILLGDIKMIRLLLDSSTGSCKAARATPWLLYEAAALCKDESQANKLVDILLSYNFAIASTNDSGRGSILAAASVVPHMTIVKRLLAGGFHTGCVALGHISRPENLSDGYETYKHTLERITGKSALHVAVSCGHEDLVKLLLSYGADVNQACGSYPIQEAACDGSATIVALLVKARADVNLREYSEDFMKHFTEDYIKFWPAILLALHRNHIEAAEILRSAGAILVNDVPEGLATHLTLTRLVKEGTQPLVYSLLNRILPQKKLASKHANLLAGRFGESFLNDLAHIGIQVMRLPSIYTIIAREDGLSSIHPNQAGNPGEPRYSSAQQLSNIVSAEGGLSVEHSLRALILAVFYKRGSIVLMLLRLGLDPFKQISKPGDDIAQEVDAQFYLRPGQSAFNVALVYFRERIARIFLDWKSGALHDDSNSFRHQEMCRAYVLALCGNFLGWRFDCSDDEIARRLIDLLAEYGIDIAAAKQALGPLYVRKCLYGGLCNAIYCKYYHTMKRILGQQTWCDMVNPPEVELGNTPLQLLVRADETQHVRELLDLSANVNAKADDLCGATALQFAAMKGNFEIVDMLIEAGADVNAPPAACDGRTAIEGAAESGRLDMVHYLLEAGADIQDQKNYRRTVYRAWKNGHRTIARMVYRWKKEKHGEEDCEAPETVVKNMIQLELDWELPILGDLGEDVDESDVNSRFDPLARYRDLQQSRRQERQIIEDNLANDKEEFLSGKEEFSSDE